MWSDSMRKRDGIESWKVDSSGFSRSSSIDGKKKGKGKSSNGSTSEQNEMEYTKLVVITGERERVCEWEKDESSLSS